MDPGDGAVAVTSPWREGCQGPDAAPAPPAQHSFTSTLEPRLDTNIFDLGPMAAEDERVLGDDIELNGVLEPVDITDEGVILDGLRRARLAKERGIACPMRVHSGLSEAEQVAFRVKVNALQPCHPRRRRTCGRRPDAPPRRERGC